MPCERLFSTCDEERDGYNFIRLTEVRSRGEEKKSEKGSGDGKVELFYSNKSGHQYLKSVRYILMQRDKIPIRRYVVVVGDLLVSAGGRTKADVEVGMQGSRLHRASMSGRCGALLW